MIFIPYVIIERMILSVNEYFFGFVHILNCLFLKAVFLIVSTVEKCTFLQASDSKKNLRQKMTEIFYH
jgi:hypothetical protein